MEYVKEKNIEFHIGFAFRHRQDLLNMDVLEKTYDTPIKGVGMFHKPIYAINGTARKQLIKERNKLRSFIRGFSWHTQVNNDMYSFYGPEEKIIHKDEENKILGKAQLELDKINSKLQEPYSGDEPNRCEDNDHFYAVEYLSQKPRQCMFCGFWDL
jgi:hypothetical protein